MTELAMEVGSTNTRHSMLVVMVTRSSIVTRVGVTVATWILTRVSGVARATMTQIAPCLRWPHTDTFPLMVTWTRVTRVLGTIPDTCHVDHMPIGSECNVLATNGQVPETALQSW